MSSDIAISVNNVSKYYQIYEKPLDRLKQSVFRGKKQFYREFKALDGISFEVKKGEIVGIIGRNGCGKSTLLQMICGTLTPSSGEITFNGRVAALLELGAGFNPEFTGRENVYMNASILGLNKDEIDSRFDDIVNFADIGEFIEQPVKTYSSGMYVRLAFSVIAHVNADILVIDEALAVGDAYFVQKCMRFLREFAEHGTLLFVSHDTGSVVSLCTRAMLLSQGKVERIGSPKDVSEYYLRMLHDKNWDVEDTKANASAESAVVDSDECARTLQSLGNEHDFGTGEARVITAGFVSSSGASLTVFKGGEDVDLMVTSQVLCDVCNPIIGFIVKDRLGQTLFGMHSYNQSTADDIAHEGQVIEANFFFKVPRLVQGDYSITVSISSGTPEMHAPIHWLNDALIFEVVQDDFRFGVFELDHGHVDLKYK